MANRETNPLNPLVAYEDDPVGNSVHHPYSAFNQGWDAGEQGHGEWLNPYPEGRERRWWEQGWVEATEEESDG